MTPLFHYDVINSNHSYFISIPTSNHTLPTLQFNHTNQYFHRTSQSPCLDTVAVISPLRVHPSQSHTQLLIKSPPPNTNHSPRR